MRLADCSTMRRTEGLDRETLLAVFDDMREAMRTSDD